MGPQSKMPLETTAKTRTELSRPAKRKSATTLIPSSVMLRSPFLLACLPSRSASGSPSPTPRFAPSSFPVKTDKMELKDLTKLRVKQLKKILEERGVSYKGLLEKEEFIKKVQETEHLAGDEF